MKLKYEMDLHTRIKSGKLRHPDTNRWAPFFLYVSVEDYIFIPLNVNGLRVKILKIMNLNGAQHLVRNVGVLRLSRE
tara:strand:+ start:351 stop:581 length:231 start_codon:yes stop_codon:yes gene_type:complete